MDETVQTEQPLAVGATLAQERERLGLSRAEVAQRLHMSLSQVDALEGGDYERLPKGTFLRGFVRNYAKIVGSDPESMVAMLAAAPRDATPHIVVPSDNIRFGNERLSNSPYVKAGVLAMIVVALGFAGMYWWVFVRPSPPAADVEKAPDVPQAKQIAEPPPQFAPAKAETPVVPAEPPKLLETPKAAEAPRVVLPGEKTLKFRFKGESWVEVTDGRGRMLVSRVNAPGTETEVSGKPPFVVIVGNAADVNLLYDNREFSLEPHTKVAVARFTLD